jgi:poly(3-hydroxybutyrate) depolymerase
LLTIEGEHDDISGVGQTEAAQRLCFNIPPERKAHWLQPGVGHYGVFNGSRFRSEIAPRISDFVLSASQSGRSRRLGAPVRHALHAINGGARPQAERSSRTGSVRPVRVD